MSSRTAPQSRFLPKRVLSTEVQPVSSDSEDEDSDYSFQYDRSFSDDKELNEPPSDAPVTWSGSALNQDYIRSSASQTSSRLHTFDSGFKSLSSVPEEHSDFKDTPIKPLPEKESTVSTLTDIPEDRFVKETPSKAALETLSSNAFIGSTSKRRPLGDLPGSNHKPLISSTKYTPSDVKSRVQLNLYTPIKEDSKVINSDIKPIQEQLQKENRLTEKNMLNPSTYINNQIFRSDNNISGNNYVIHTTPDIKTPLQKVNNHEAKHSTGKPALSIDQKENVPTHITDTVDVQSTTHGRQTPLQVLNNCDLKHSSHKATISSEPRNSESANIYKHSATPIISKCDKHEVRISSTNSDGSPLKINSQLLEDNLDINKMLNQNANHESPALKTKNDQSKKLKSPEVPLFPKLLEKPLEQINNVLKTETEKPVEKKDDNVFKTPAPIPVAVKKVEDKKEIIMVNGKKYNVLGLIGRGGSSKVYQVSNERNLLMAIKVVDLSDADSSVVDGYKNEIDLLKRLQHSNRVVKMYDYEYRGEKLFVIMEKGEDLSNLIKNRNKSKSITREVIKFYWSEMLRAVQVIHKEGIIHSDLKPANFLLVGGCLKLIDFGIASSIQSDKTSVIKDVQTGTFNYISPEALSDTQHGPNPQYKIGIRSDIWSLGCILYNLAYQKTPFQHITKMFPKLAAIMDPNHKIDFPLYEDSSLVDVLQLCLNRDARARPTVEELLAHPYLHQPQATPEAPELAKLIHTLKAKDLTPTRISKIEQFVQRL